MGLYPGWVCVAAAANIAAVAVAVGIALAAPGYHGEHVRSL